MSNDKEHTGIPANTFTRRQMIARAAIAFGSLAAGARVFGQAQQQSMKETPSTAANEKRTSIHLEEDYKVGPARIYEALLDAKQFAAFSGFPAEIDRSAGGAFSMFGGLIVGRNVDLVTNQRIVQAWRPTHWDAGVYSIVKFELKDRGSFTAGGHSVAFARLVLDHTGFPEGEYDHLLSGWHEHYIDRLTSFLV